MQLALRVVEPPGAGPAVGAAEDRLVSEFPAHPIQLVGDERIGLFPAHRCERVDPPPLGQRAGAVVQPAFAHHGRVHPRRTVLNVENSLADGGRIVVMLECQQILHPAVADAGAIGAPMGAGERQ